MNPTTLLSASRRLLDPSAPRREDDVRLVAEAWSELLGQPDAGNFAFADGKSVYIEGAYAVNTVGALRLAADIIRAVAEVEAAGKGGE